MVTLNPYLNFNGNTEEAFNFYKSVFGGEFTMLHRFKDTPEADKLAAKERQGIMHIALPIGNEVLLGTDAPESMGFKLQFGNNMSLSVEVENKRKADTIFKKLSQGGKVNMPLKDMFWGSYWGFLTDKFGIQWMVSNTLPI